MSECKTPVEDMEMPLFRYVIRLLNNYTHLLIYFDTEDFKKLNKISCDYH